jgi:hypothetical protein
VQTKVDRSAAPQGVLSHELAALSEYGPTQTPCLALSRPYQAPQRVRRLDLQVIAGRRVDAGGGGFDSTVARAPGARQIADFAMRSAKSAEFMTL